jgi:hypothetical protein
VYDRVQLLDLVWGPDTCVEPRTTARPSDPHGAWGRLQVQPGRVGKRVATAPPRPHRRGE